MKRRLAILILAFICWAIPSLATAHVPTMPMEDGTRALPGTSQKTGPVMVVLDTSGSMNETDPNNPGQTKLDTAKQAINELLSETRTPFGLITYPSGTTGEELPAVDSCAGGRVLLQPGNRDISENTAVVNAMTADGGTPTGPALKASAHWLAQRGFRNATIILVTDGEENCGPSLCDVAQRITDTGINLTVHGIGLSDEEGVNSSLSCITQATGGTAVSGVDIQDLKPQLRKFSGGSVELSVEAPGTMKPLGRTTRRQTLQVTITPKGQKVINTRIRVTAHNSLGKVVATPVPVRYAGTLSADIPVTLNLPLQPGYGDIGELKWKVIVEKNVRPQSNRYRYESIAQTSGTLTVVGESDSFELGPLLKDKKNVVILGDSFSSGENAPPYILGSGDEDWENRCHRSAYTHGAILYPDASIIACSGAVTEDFYDFQPKHSGGTQKAVPPQFQAIEDLPQAPDLVIMTIGGNDSGFANVVEGVFAEGSVHYFFAGGLPKPGKIIPSDLRQRISSVLLGVDSRVNSPQRVAQRNGAIAPILVLPYPRVITGLRGHQKCTLGISPDERKFLAQFQEMLNAEVLLAATSVGKDRPIYFVKDVVDAFLSEDVCASDTPIAVTGVVDAAYHAKITKNFGSSRFQELFHPTPRGYRMEAEAIASWSLRDGLRDPQSFGPAAEKVGHTRPFESAIHRFTRQRLEDAGLKSAADRGEYNLNCRNISTDDYETREERICRIVRGTPRTYFQVRSEPRSLGFYETGPETTSLTIRLPHDLEPGNHTLIAYGLDENGKPASAELPIYVPSEAEQNAIVLAAYGVVSLVLALLCAIPAGIIALLRRRRHRSQTASA